MVSVLAKYLWKKIILQSTSHSSIVDNVQGNHRWGTRSMFETELEIVLSGVSFEAALPENVYFYLSGGVPLI